MRDRALGFVVITGASSGIGRASALLLDKLGFRVFAGVRRQADAENLRRSGSARLTPLFLDLNKLDSIANAALEVAEVLNGRGLAGLVNNAGGGMTGPLEFGTWEEILEQTQVNLLGHIAVTRAFLKQLRAARGRVINVGSIGAVQPLPFSSIYAASKAGLHAFTQALRMEVGQQGISVVLVIPGQVATAIWGKLSVAGDSLTAGLPDEGRALYGSMMKTFGQGVRKMAEAGGVSPETVAKVIAQALTARQPKTQYVVGCDARVQILLSKLLPNKVRESMVLRAMGFTTTKAESGTTT